MKSVLNKKADLKLSQAIPDGCPRDTTKMSPVARAHSTQLSQTKKGFERLKTEFLSFYTPHN